MQSILLFPCILELALDTLSFENRKKCLNFKVSLIVVVFHLVPWKICCERFFLISEWNMELKNMVALVSRTGRHLQRYERGCRQVVGFVKHPSISLSLSLSLSRDHPTYLHATMNFFILLVHLQFSLGISFFRFPIWEISSYYLNVVDFWFGLV